MRGGRARRARAFPAPDLPADEAPIRIDRWLWFARFFKTRGTAARLCAAGRVRVDGRVVEKPNFPLRPGCVVTFPQGRRIRVVRVLAPGVRRGPAAEAAALYEDLSDAPPVPAPPRVVAARRPRR